jgi:small subunit ribosomal protein S15
MGLTKEIKDKVIAEFHINENDTGSAGVQIALLTTRIIQLTDHLRINKHDEASRRGMLKMVGQRRRLLAYVRKTNFERYIALTERLSIRQK